MKTFTMTADEFQDRSNDNEGACTACGEEAYGVEPDAREYKCESCGAKSVYGLDELMLMGLIDIEE